MDEKPKYRNKFFEFVDKHKVKIVGVIGAIAGGLFVHCTYKLADNMKVDPLTSYENASLKEDDSVIITDTYDIDYDGKTYRGFSILDKDPIE